MSIENRREREKEEMKELILSAASDIVAADGFDKLSIRKIATKIEYSPAIIYHYFADKEEILNNLMQRGYNKIVTAISSAKIRGKTPEDRFKEMMKNYIEAALQMPDEFMAVHLNQSPQALQQTSSLFEGASKTKTAIAALYDSIKEVNEDKELEHSKIELTAQLIVVSAVGLVIKLIIEKDTSNEQKQKLIEYYCNEVILRMAKIV